MFVGIHTVFVGCGFKSLLLRGFLGAGAKKQTKESITWNIYARDQHLEMLYNIYSVTLVNGIDIKKLFQAFINLG